jgi:hypothetical protein
MVSLTHCVIVGNSSIICCTLNNVKTRKLCVKKINFKSYDCNALQQNGSDKVK